MLLESILKYVFVLFSRNSETKTTNDSFSQSQNMMDDNEEFLSPTFNSQNRKGIRIKQEVMEQDECNVDSSSEPHMTNDSSSIKTEYDEDTLIVTKKEEVKIKKISKKHNHVHRKVEKLLEDKSNDVVPRKKKKNKTQ